MSSEPEGYARCIGCDKQWDARFVNDEGICAWCRLPVMTVPANPLLTAGDQP